MASASETSGCSALTADLPCRLRKSPWDGIPAGLRSFRSLRLARHAEKNPGRIAPKPGPLFLKSVQFCFDRRRNPLMRVSRPAFAGHSVIPVNSAFTLLTRNFNGGHDSGDRFVAGRCRALASGGIRLVPSGDPKVKGRRTNRRTVVLRGGTDAMRPDRGHHRDRASHRWQPADWGRHRPGPARPPPKGLTAALVSARSSRA